MPWPIAIVKVSLTLASTLYFHLKHNTMKGNCDKNINQLGSTGD
jgi:hypothetical protein